MSCEGFLIAFKNVFISHAPKCTVNGHSYINYVLQFFEYLRNKLGGNLNYNLKLGQIMIGL